MPLFYPTTTEFKGIIRRVLGELISVGSDVALFDFPNYSNIGDSMIWRGQDRYLRETAKARVVAVKDIGTSSFRFPSLDRSVTILFQGGGNTGDLWPRIQEAREQVIERYPKNRIIQMPQSIHFEDETGYERVRQVYSGHQDFHFLARDSKSLELSKRLVGERGILCPDLALMLDPIAPRGTPRNTIISLLREDKEKNLAARQLEDADSEKTDWIDEDITRTMKIGSRLRRFQNELPWDSDLMFTLKHLIYNRIARQRLERGIRLLSGHSVVITDRLHAYMLSCLLGIPTVVIDNSYGKIFSVIDTWKTFEHLTFKASCMSEAREKALYLHQKCRSSDR
jgi:pyruvyl transferase EpsO